MPKVNKKKPHRHQQISQKYEDKKISKIRDFRNLILPLVFQLELEKISWGIYLRKHKN